MALELLEADVDSAAEELLERTLDAVLLHQGGHVPELASGRAEQLEIGAPGVGEDGALDEAEERGVARRGPV
jgi:hypothetical protein